MVLLKRSGNLPVINYTDTETKLLGHTDRLADLFSNKVSPPINVEIDLCNRCSLGCDWCHFAHTHTRGPLANRKLVNVGDLMDADLAIRLVKELANYGVRSITWTGGGEPTLHPHYLQILELVTIDQGLYTNGCHIDSAAADRLAKRLQWIYVSLDEVDAKSYRESKKANAFDKACEGIRCLSLSGMTVGVGFLLHKSNYTRTEDMASLAMSLGASYVQFRPTIEFDASNPSVSTADKDWARSVIVRGNNQPKILTDYNADRFHAYADWKGHGYDTCWWSALQTVITPDGRVWTCCNKRGEQGNCLGDLNNESFEAIWSRREVAKVNDRCRIMCRGHIGNQCVNNMLTKRPHGNFI